jgi:hypothetical protein
VLLAVFDRLSLRQMAKNAQGSRAVVAGEQLQAGEDELPDSSRLRLEITCDDELLTYCEACWESEFGDV